MKIYSWNVNGIRACVKNGFGAFLASEKPDILGLQETKIAHKDIEGAKFDFPGYKEYWHPAQRPGYSGTAILVKESLLNKVVSATNGWGDDDFDNEGR